jgi:hypothetical protein
MGTSAESGELLAKYGRAPSRPRRPLLLRRRSPSNSSASASPASSSGSEREDGPPSRTVPLSRIPTEEPASAAASSAAADTPIPATSVFSPREAGDEEPEKNSSLAGYAALSNVYVHGARPGRHTRQFFDSADWMMSVEGLRPQPVRCPGCDAENKGGLPSCYPVADAPDAPCSEPTARFANREGGDSTPTANDKYGKPRPRHQRPRPVFRPGLRERAAARVYFDSADYELSNHSCPQTLHTYKGGFTNDVLPTTTVAHQLRVPPRKKYFDSADWGLASAGLAATAADGAHLPPRVRAALEASRPNAAFAIVRGEGAEGTAVPCRDNRRRRSRHVRGKRSTR